MFVVLDTLLTRSLRTSLLLHFAHDFAFLRCEKIVNASVCFIHCMSVI